MMLMPKGILAKKKNHKKSTDLDHSYLKYALDTNNKFKINNIDKSLKQ